MRRLAGLVMAGALMVPAVAAAQTPDRTALEASCAAGAPEGPTRDTCLWVVERILAPDPGATPPAEYGADLPGPGVVLVGDMANVTLERVAWNTKPGGYGEPGSKSRLISLLVLYEATQDGASYNPYDWSMVDFDGFNYDRFSAGRRPELSGSNSLPMGRKARGWVTFEAPQAVHSFEVVADIGGDVLAPAYGRWRIDEPR